jgi:hypothetical protein
MIDVSDTGISYVSILHVRTEIDNIVTCYATEDTRFELLTPLFTS